MRISARTSMLVIVLAISACQSAIARIIYYHNDGLGSPVAATDQQGNVLWRAGYRPFGDRDQNVQDYAASLKNHRWYTGHPHDDAIGLTYIQARYYDPVIGRFMGVDPLSFRVADPQTFNRYVYARNNPYKYKDPNGLDSIVISWKGSAAVGAGLSIGGGIYVTYPGQDHANFDVGSIATISAVAGADVSLTGNISMLHGGRENVEGTTINASVTVPVTGPSGLAVDYESVVNKDTGQWAGQSIGIGLSAFPAASVSVTETVITFSIRDWFESTSKIESPENNQPDPVQLTEQQLIMWYGFSAN